MDLVEALLLPPSQQDAEHLVFRFVRGLALVFVEIVEPEVVELSAQVVVLLLDELSNMQLAALSIIPALHGLMALSLNLKLSSMPTEPP